MELVKTNERIKSRRRFFGVTVSVGILAVLGLAQVRDKKRTTYYIGPDGKLYEVDRSKVKKVGMCAKGSKKSLKSWIERHLKNG